ncbi:MAG: LacI family DNA-binding transcriptional regulator [Acidobacteriota bacterium]
MMPTVAKPRTGSGAGGSPPSKPVSLKELAAHLGLSPSTVSLVLNQSAGSESIPPETQQRILAAARKLNYRPNFLARSLRSMRTYAVGVMVPELSEGYSSLVLSGIEDRLMEEGYMCLAASHRHSRKQIELLPRLFYERCVDGLIAVDTPYPLRIPLPIVSVSGHLKQPGVTNIVLDHDRAAALGLGHLLAFGHRRIAVIKGQSFSSDTEVRWNSIEAAARRLGCPIDERLIVQLEGESPSPETGYVAAQRLLERGVAFTALFAFNDVSAFGAIRAFREHGLDVPADVSVVGFDDVWGAAFHLPSLTTIRQPLRRMGQLAAETLFLRIRQGNDAESCHEIQVEPELVVRESTGPVRDIGR